MTQHINQLIVSLLARYIPFTQSDKKYGQAKWCIDGFQLDTIGSNATSRRRNAPAVELRMKLLNTSCCANMMTSTSFGKQHTTRYKKTREKAKLHRTSHDYSFKLFTRYSRSNVRCHHSPVPHWTVQCGRWIHCKRMDKALQHFGVKHPQTKSELLLTLVCDNICEPLYHARNNIILNRLWWAQTGRTLPCKCRYTLT